MLTSIRAIATLRMGFRKDQWNQSSNQIKSSKTEVQYVDQIMQLLERQEGNVRGLIELGRGDSDVGEHIGELF